MSSFRVFGCSFFGQALFVILEFLLKRVRGKKGWQCKVSEDTYAAIAAAIAAKIRAAPTHGPVPPPPLPRPTKLDLARS